MLVVVLAQLRGWLWFCDGRQYFDCRSIDETGLKDCAWEVGSGFYDLLFLCEDS